MKTWILAVVMSTVAGVASAKGNSLCKVNPYTREEAQQGKVQFDSHCGLCHQYSMLGRTPGNYKNEIPDINLLSETDLAFLDHGGGNVPPLFGPKFFDKWNGKTFTEFAATVSSAANTFPTKNQSIPGSYLLVAAYVLSRNCGML